MLEYRKITKRSLIIALFLTLLLPPCALGARQEGTISGFVRDAANGEFMPYVNVFLKGTTLGTTSNERGYYVINRIPPGEYTLVFSMMGYERLEEKVRIVSGAQVKRSVLLKPGVIELEGVVKTAERERFEREVQVSATTLTARQISTLPTVAETDLFRTIQLLPGVVSRSDFSSQLYVRGGSPDQNLVLLDGVTVYNPFHLLGLFSMFNADAVKEVEFITGGFPAEYGGRLSSVLRIVNNEGNSKAFAGHGNISLLSARATVEGPIPRGSYLISGRRTYFDQLFKGTKYEFPYYFYDFQGKVNIDLNDNHRLTLSGFYGDDKLDYQLANDDDFSVGIDWLWGNRTTSLYWRWLIHPNLYSEVLMTRSKFTLDLDFELHGDNLTGLRLQNGIQDRSVKADLSYFGWKNHSLRFGTQQTWFDFLYAFTLDEADLFNYQRKPMLTAAYIQDEWQIGRRTSLLGGLRQEHYSFGDRTTWSPRVSVKHRIASDFALKGSLGLYHQFLTTASSDNQNYQFIDLWFPLSAQYKPLRAFHSVIGLEWWLPYELIITAEGYYKRMDRLLELNESGSAADEDDDFFVGDGHAAGAELMLKKNAGRLNGWASYSFAVTRRRTDGLTYYPKHDRRHNLNLALNFDLGKKWSLGLVFTYGSGLPYTPVIGKYTHYDWNFSRNQAEQTIYNRLGAKNSYRYPAYHRMDVSLRRPFRIGGVVCDPYVQIVNLYNRHNVFLYVWNHDANPSKLVTIPMFPVFPSAGVEFDF